MNKQERQYALESDFINGCLVIRIALLLAPRPAAVISCVSVCPQADVGTHSCSCPHWDITCALKWLSCSKHRRCTYNPLLELTDNHAVRGNKAQGLGCWPGTTPGAPQYLSLVLVQTNRAMPGKPLCLPLTFSKLLILSDHKLVSCC